MAEAADLEGQLEQALNAHGRADMRGVTILGAGHGRIDWVRLYVEPVEQDGAGLDVAITEQVEQS